MIVEFLGTSGAGKSTLIPVVTNLLRDDGLMAMSAPEAIHFHMRKTFVGRLVCFLAPSALRGSILWGVFSFFMLKFYIAKFAVTNPQLACHVVRLQWRRPIPWQHRWSILRLFFQMTGWHQFLKSRLQPTEVLVLDEGFAHRATHMFVSASEQPDAEQIAAYLKLLPRPDLVIRVQTPLDTCLARIHSRGQQPRLRALQPQDAVRFVTNQEEVANITSWYLENAGLEVLSIENDGDLTASAADLRHKLSEYLSRRSAMARRAC
jgi:thymidylate kinase